MTGKTWAFEDFVEGSTIDLGAKDVTAEEIIEFAGEFDPQPMHLDEAAGKASILGGLSASGWHTCAMYMRLLCDAFLLDAASLGAGSVDEVQWLRPIRPGDRLTLRCIVLETRTSRSRPELGIVHTRHELYNAHGEHVMTMVAPQMLRRRNPGAPS